MAEKAVGLPDRVFAGENGLPFEINGIGSVVSLETVDHLAEEAACDAGMFPENVIRFGRVVLQVE